MAIADRTTPWIIAMRWLDLLFIHWPIRPAVLRPLIPSRLELDTFEGDAYIGVVPFRMAGVRARFTPALPRLSAFPELNVRTYVKTPTHRGVWFLSLDATSRITVFSARLAFFLPYHLATMCITDDQGSIHYTSRRRSSPAEFQATYHPTGPVYASCPGDLDHWLTERYALFSADRNGKIHRGDVFHAPWPLQPTEADIRLNTMLAPLNIGIPDTPPLLHFSRRLETVANALAAA